MSLEWSENGDEENVVIVLGDVIDIAVLLSEWLFKSIVPTVEALPSILTIGGLDNSN